MDLPPPTEYHCVCLKSDLSAAAQGLLLIIKNQDEPLDFIEYLFCIDRDDVLFEPFHELWEKGWIE